MPVIGIVFTIKDDKGLKSTFTLNIPGATAGVDALEFAGDMAQLVASIVTGKLMTVGVHFSIDISGLSDNALGALSDVEEGARFSWGTVGDFIAVNRLATFDEAMIDPNSRQVDQTDTDVAAFIDAVTQGLTMTSTELIRCVDSRDAIINGIEGALESFQSSRMLRNQ